MEVAVGVVFATVVLTTFFHGVPCELEEAARIDGATSGQVLRHVIFPLVAPGIAAVTVLQSVFVWNDYFAPLIVIQKPDLSTVQTGDGELFEFLRDRSSRALCRSCNRDGATAGRVRGPAAEFYPHPGVDGGCVARPGALVPTVLTEWSSFHAAVGSRARLMESITWLSMTRSAWRSSGTAGG